MLIEKRFLHTFGAAWPRAIGPALTIAPNGDWLCHWISGPQPERDGQPGLSAVYKRSPDGGQTWGQLRVWIEPDAPDRCGHGHPNYVQDGEIVAFGLTFDSGRDGWPAGAPSASAARTAATPGAPGAPARPRGRGDAGAGWCSRMAAGSSPSTTSGPRTSPGRCCTSGPSCAGARPLGLAWG